MNPLSGHVGAWAGENAFRLMPEDPVVSSPATAGVTPAAGGNVVVLAYTWAHPDDGPQDGVLLLGPASPAGSEAPDGGRTAVWGDSWHQAPEPRSLDWTEAGGATGTVTLGYDYTDDGWRWQVVLDLTDPDLLRVRMDNVPPETAGMSTYPAMVMVLRRG